MDVRRTKPKSVLLMTATINTSPKMRNNVRSDSEVRRRDYEASLEAYLSLPAGPLTEILFCENSGADISTLLRISKEKNPHDRKVNFITYQSDVPPELGKSHAELEILSRAHAEVFRSCQEVMVWKVTGRLFVRNLNTLIQSCPYNSGIYCDMRSVKALGNRVWSNFWVDTRLIAYTPNYFEKYILPISDQERMRKGSIEAAVFDVLRPVIENDTGVVPRFRHQPVFSGVCGGSNDDYEGAKYQIKTYMRSAARKVTPWIWI